jgi:hypothetical protein
LGAGIGPDAEWGSADAESRFADSESAIADIKPDIKPDVTIVLQV